MVALPPVEEDAIQKTAGFTARQRWLWAFDLVTKVMARDGMAGRAVQIQAYMGNDLFIGS